MSCIFSYVCGHDIVIAYNPKRLTSEPTGRVRVEGDVVNIVVDAAQWHQQPVDVSVIGETVTHRLSVRVSGTCIITKLNFKDS